MLDSDTCARVQSVQRVFTAESYISCCVAGRDKLNNAVNTKMIVALSIDFSFAW